MSTQGLHVGVPETLTNARYADDIIVYAKTADELMFMMNALMEEFNKSGLHLSPLLKTKTLMTVDVAPLYLDIAGSMLEVLMHADVHKYLGRHISGNLSQKHVTELRHRIRVAWYAFQRHRKMLTNKHVSIKLRLKLFNAVVTPTILYGLHRLPLTHFQLCKDGCSNQSLVGSVWETSHGA